MVAAVTVHAVVGFVILISGLVTHWAILQSGMVAWALGCYLIWRWRRRLGRVIAIPFVVAGGYALALAIGDQFGLIGG